MNKDLLLFVGLHLLYLKLNRKLEDKELQKADTEGNFTRKLQKKLEEVTELRLEYYDIAKVSELTLEENLLLMSLC